MDKLSALIKSRKFWAAIVGLALIVVKAWRPDFPLAEDQLTSIVWVLVAFILGTGLEDAGGQGAMRAFVVRKPQLFEPKPPEAK